MKLVKTITFFTLAALLIACGSGVNTSALISGTIEKGAGKTLFLDDINGTAAERVGTVTIKNDGTFEFNAKIKQKGIYRLGLSPTNFIVLILDSTEHVGIEADGDSLSLETKITNSPENELLAKYMAVNYDFQKTRSELGIKFEKLSMVDTSRKTLDSLAILFDKELNEIGSKNAEKIKDLLVKNPGMFANLYLLQEKMLDPAKYLDLYVKDAELLGKAYPTLPVIQDFVARVSLFKTVAVGQVAPEITLPNPAGEKISLSSLRGKLVLIDFWASWCGPCRKENPNVVKIYNKYKDKGFTVFGVSLDKPGEKENWVKAIKDDGLTWNHVSELSFWNSAVARQYDIDGIPATYLIDRQGKILKRNLRGKELDAFIGEFLAKEKPDTTVAN